ncbi:histidine kinase-, DNA gyrase b-, and HSP90-like ATPase domain-containing protein [Sarocladium implicatum]|nr:histidine kinase-, DNA gyrase b-, and HSP90-like ATPase domain-containing protein [Sarocladium implicatum]
MDRRASHPPPTSNTSVSMRPSKQGSANHGKEDSVVPQAPRRSASDDPASMVSTGASANPTSQQQLSDYREKLARDLERRELSARGLLGADKDKSRISPIQEEAAFNSPLLNSGLTTTSTESGNTIRGGITPAPIAGTPSYPFPRMGYPGFNYGYMASSLHRPFTTLSPTGAQEGTAGLSRAQDKVLSGNTTPASNVTFFPSGASPFPENFDFPTPNLYDLSLMLSAEPGLDAWWNTVVHIMKDVYRAERVTLSVPADATDLENVPWGQKATYNEHQEDELSLGYMAQASSAKRSSDPDLFDVLSQEDLASPRFHVRPGMHSRHSFTSFEDNKEREQDQPTQGSLRPSYLTRSRSHLTTSTDLRNAAEAPQLDSDALEEHDAEVVQAIPSWEEPLMARNQGKGRLLPVLQALDYEADPLIDHSGVMRVLERGTTVALTRSYPYLSNPPPPETQAGQSAANKTTQTEGSNKGRQKGPEPTPNLASILSGSSTRNKRTGPSEKAKSKSSRKEEDAPKVSTPNYEEFEQAPPSPWSQSPAPSPAVRADPKENPFFTDATVDEDSFNPGSAPADYAGMRPPEAIGVENSWTVLHIPLSHVLLSSAPPPFRLDPAAMESRSANASKQGTGPDPRSRDTASPIGGKSTKAAPIAILSILSPFIPYPSSLRHSLEHLAPHMATSFSLCRHYSNLETELAGMQRRRPPTTGFGAVAPDGRPLDTTIFVTSEDIARQQSLPGSMTSPSDYSGVSKSVTGSPAGTPGWEHGSFSYIMDKRNVASPAAVTGGGESYFSSKQKSTLSSSGPSRSGSKDTSPSEKKTSRPSTSKAVTDLGTTDETPEILSEEALGGIAQGTRTTYHQDLSEPSATTFAVTPSGEHLGEALRLDRLAQQAGHTKLHSYGADFASTFQSLPPSSTVGTRPTMPLSRPSSFAPGPADMPPPSDRLKGLILDSLPAHVFVALPQSGEIVWVNSRFLSYRGQTVSDLTVDPWGSIHADDRGEYLKSWSHSLRTGEQFSRTVRIKRFDGAYRWFYARAVASKDKRGVIMQFLGSYMDIHDQHIAELKAARQEEIAASNAKHHLLANLIPQIIFTATEEDGITFANEQWLSYTGQSLEDSLGLGFMDFVHPEDLARCRIPVQQPVAASHTPRDKAWKKEPETSSDSASTGTVIDQQQSNEAPSSRTRLQSLSRENSSGSSSIYEMSAADLTELARSGVIKVGTDSDGRPSYTTEVRLRSKSGEYRWHLIRCVEIDTIDFGSGASSYFGSATDINDHKLLEAKLKEAMESKGRFLSNMSHEIRTPLIGISGMVTFLQDTKLNDEQLDYTNTIQTSANSLIMIINDILDLSKVDAGMMKLNYEWFHARSLIEDVNELVSTMAIAKRLELNYLVESDVPAWVKGDKVRIRQVLLNVIGNAIKFTSEGEVFSHCKVLQTEDHETGHPEIALEFSVIDTGRGFSEEEAALIFKPFSQIDTSSTRQHGGSGLGLVISKQLVELHGGHMEGKAVLGKGSTFTFSARFGLPTVEDHPHQPGSPNSTMYSAASRQLSTESVPGSIKPLPAPKHLRNTAGSSPSGTDLGFTSSDVTSTGSSEPSVHSARSHVTDRSSNTSVNTGLARFSEAAKASGQDITHMKLEMPSEKSSPGGTATPATHGQLSPEEFRPPMYSILIICPQLHSREATGQHIETTLPKDVPRQITALGSVQEAQKYIGGDDPINFTHIVINLPSPESILSLLEQIAASQKLDKTAVLILSDSVQRQEVMKLAADSDHEEFLSENLVNFIYKPVKPSRFAVIFDPNRERDVSIDRNKSTAQQLVEAQKASYEEIQKLVVNKGHRVLLVEDNPVNQKVLLKYLQKIGVGVDVAVDGVECTDKVLSKPHKHYSLILCDLHMPRKDGYQTCREIRQWERVAHYPKMPIIALSADVLADVQHKCVAAGFSDYVAKPVDFIELGKAMIQVFDPKAQPRTRN